MNVLFIDNVDTFTAVPSVYNLHNFVAVAAIYYVFVVSYFSYLDAIAVSCFLFSVFTHSSYLRLSIYHYTKMHL